MSRAVLRGEKELGPIPERRGAAAPPSHQPLQTRPPTPGSLALPVWRCKVCGYLCARDEPPEVCPICKAKKERFERFL